MNIYPREVEEALLTHPQVEAAAVVGRSDPDWGESLLSKIPGYDYLKQESASALGVAQIGELPVVFVPMEGGWQLGVQTEALSGGLVSIFVPGPDGPGRSHAGRSRPGHRPHRRHHSRRCAAGNATPRHRYLASASLSDEAGALTSVVPGNGT